MEAHPHHEASFECAFMTMPHTSVVAVHTLAEVYSNLTGMPGKQRATPEQALTYLSQIRERFDVVTLNALDYVETISGCVNRGMTGSGVYDALVGQCAVKAGVSILYTWNTKHFLRLGPDVAKLVRTPELSSRQ